MIQLQIVNDQYIYLNPDYIEVVESGAEHNNHNTVVKIHDGTSYVVKQSPEEVVQSIEDWHRRCARPAPRPTRDAAEKSGTGDESGKAQQQ